MKAIHKLLTISIALFAIVSCKGEYDAPPLNVPNADLKANITITQLIEKAKTATADAPFVITDDLVMRVYISANDEGGNIYKQIFIQDNEAAMQVQVDKGNINALYRRGQEVFIKLKGMSISVYGDEMQLGWPEAKANAYRMPYEIFEDRFKKNGMPNVANVSPIEIEDISLINADVSRYLFKLVKLNNVYFVNGGTNTFAKEGKFPTNEELKDSKGNSIIVRTSSFSNFAGNKLPVGKGSLVGVLSRFRGTWQLLIPSADDVHSFDGIAVGGSNNNSSGNTNNNSGSTGNNDSGNTNTTPATPTEKVLFNETFGTPSKNGNFWPKLDTYQGYDNDRSMFSGDISQLDVRMVGKSPEAYSNVWYKAGSAFTLKVSGIKVQGSNKITLVYGVGANLFAKEGDPAKTFDIRNFVVKCNGTALTIPEKVLSSANNEGNKPYEVRIENISVSGDVTLEFSSVADTNKDGIRLFSVKVLGSN